MNLPEGLPAWAYIVVSAWCSPPRSSPPSGSTQRGREGSGDARRDNEHHEMPLRDDLDDKALRTLDAIESLRGAVDGLRDDMNGEFATVNRRITTTEQNLIELRHEVNDLRRGRKPPPIERNTNGKHQRRGRPQGRQHHHDSRSDRGAHEIHRAAARPAVQRRPDRPVHRWHQPAAVHLGPGEHGDHRRHRRHRIRVRVVAQQQT